MIPMCYVVTPGTPILTYLLSSSACHCEVSGEPGFLKLIFDRRLAALLLVPGSLEYSAAVKALKVFKLLYWGNPITYYNIPILW